MYSKTISLRFPKKVVNEPVVVDLVKKYDLSFNILKAIVYPRKEGFMVLELSGHKKNYQKGLRYLKEQGIKVKSIGHDIRRDDEVCFQCGVCTAVCPTGALSVHRPDMAVAFEESKCSVCELCVPACPTRAMDVRPTSETFFE